MEQFASFIRNIPDTELPPDRRPIKVAVIDDGIDAVYNEEQFSHSLKGGESFCTGPKRPPYFFSSTGHGTLMADLVQRVCPKVHLYVARLDELQGETRVQPTAESAANVSSLFHLIVSYQHQSGSTRFNFQVSLPMLYRISHDPQWIYFLTL